MVPRRAIANSSAAKQLSKARAAAQAAENRQLRRFKSDSKQQPAPKPDARVLQRQLSEAAACR